ncbi:MAG: hypothetical protein SOT34_08115, partial [Candidatus Borkfalkiaceae bacterium]|nr:hypothetical protein [Christensenellaceae bacterium]
MKKILILVILSLLTALFAVSAPSVSAENDPETACNGFLPIKGSAVVLSPKDDGGVSVTANKTGDGFIFEKPVTGDRIDLYIDLSCLNVRISVIFADANGNAGDWYYIQEYWGGVNVQGYGYWSDPGDDNPVGYQHFGFLLTESGTEFYYNGKYIYKSSVKKSFYGQGVSLVFGFEKDADFSADLRVGQPSLTETDRNSVIPSGEDVFFPADFNHAKVRSVVLEKDGVPITLQEEQFSVGQDGVTVRGDFIKTLSAGNYSVRIVTAAGDLIGTLHLSDDWKAEINDSTELVFDKHKGGDLTVYYFANGDKAVGVAGERITENDFVCNGDESYVTIRENYLKTLPSGISAFKLITEKAAEGISFRVTVLNSAPPLCAENEKTYDIYSPSDVVFTAEIHENELLSVSGDPVGIRDVTVENGEIKIRRTAFDGLTPGDKVTFTLRFTYGDLILSVKVVSSEKCVIYEKNKRVNKSGPISLYFSADMKYDEIVSIEGNGIEDGDYSFDPARNAIVLEKEYLSRLTQTGDYSFTVRTANGLTDVIVVSVFDALPPETADAEVKAYDKSAGGSLSFRVKANGSGLISVNGKGPDSGNYSVRSDGDDFTLTLSESFLRDLQNGPATVTAVFTGGEIEFRLEISNSLASHFETGNAVLYDVRGEGDYTVNVQTNYGRMIGVNGNGISPDDYVFNHTAGTLTISGKFLSCGSRTEPYSILLDNGELTLVLSEPLKESPTDLYVPMYTYMEPENSVVLSGSDGWAEVRYAKPKTADFAGGVKFRYLFDVSRPVTVYVDFLSVPALAGSSFVFTLSSEDYKMYYDNGYGKSELFGVFAVGNTYLQTAYFGVQPEDGIPEAQISHELLKRSDKGYETFTFDIGNASSKIYFNGTLIRETDRVTRSSFKDGKIYLLFTPHFWQEKEGAAFRIRTEAEPLSYTSGLILNTLTKKDVNIRLNTRNSVITGVYLDTDEGETPIGGCALTHDPVTGEAVLTIPA